VEQIQLALDLLKVCGSANPQKERRRKPPDDAARHLSFLRAREIDSLLYLSTDSQSTEQRLYDEVWRRQLGVLREVMKSLDGLGIPVLVLKSAELIPRAFGVHGLGLLVDVDVMVPRRYLGDVRRVLFSMDMRQAVFDPTTGMLVDRDIAEIGKIESTHYELAPFCLIQEFNPDDEIAALLMARNDHPIYLVGNKVVVVIEIDVHHGIATDVPSDQFFERAVRSYHGVGFTMCAADHAWFVLTRLYNEVALYQKQSLRAFAYTIPLVATGGIDWGVMSRVADELRLGPTLYYYLKFISWLLPGFVPDSLLELIHPLRNSRVRDWGWQLGKLFGVMEPFPLA
jgi:hypothetical protein